MESCVHFLHLRYKFKQVLNPYRVIICYINTQRKTDY